jgi:hypothetical protein
VADVKTIDIKPIVQLRFQPMWLYVDALREFCGFFARATFDDKAVGQRVGLVVHELIENAIKYGDEIELELRVEKYDSALAVIVSNTVSDEAAERLSKRFDELEGSDPATAYLDAVRDAVLKPSGVSGLGLTRIRHEGKVRLSLERQPGRVSVTARGEL